VTLLVQVIVNEEEKLFFTRLLTDRDLRAPKRQIMRAK
jgi:hypothetical protein